MVRLPSRTIRSSANSRTARASTSRSTSRPISARSSGVAAWSTRCDALLDDGALVEVGRHEVRRRADELDASRVRLVVGACALEARQEGVVDVDDPPGQPGAELVGQHLHVAREDDDIDGVLLDEGQQPVLLLGLRLRRDRQDDEGDAVALGEGPAVLVVRHDEGDVHGELPVVVPVQQVDEAVVVLRDHHEHPATRLLEAHVDRRVEARGPLLDHVPHGGRVVARGLEAGAHGEQAGVLVRELRLLEHVRRHVEQCARHGVDDAGAVLAGEGEDEVGHAPIVV